ncbi:MAG TPA: preprotein translocase subunit SecE [Conexibacter sp.]|nr:preprotein translocase subunit SecE [Conexibacter sp.]
MARDRRRSKQRRERDARSDGPSANHADGGALPDENPLHQHEPAEFASGEVDIADAQLAMGRPELADANAADEPSLGGSTAEELFESARDDDGGPLVPAGGGSGGGDEVAGVARTGERSPEPKRGGGRFINFLRGSWRELQRVQWPDRTQVTQATAVVIGFVLLSGAFLGAADWVSQRIVDLII